MHFQIITAAVSAICIPHAPNPPSLKPADAISASGSLHHEKNVSRGAIVKATHSNSFLKRLALQFSLAAMSMLSVTTVTAQTCGLDNFTVGLFNNASVGTGTPPFDTGDTCTVGGTAHTPGNDACNTDSVVRNNDTYIYRFNYRLRSGESEDNITFTTTLPQVGGVTIATWDGLPFQCSGAGSAITNGGRTLTCNIGTIDRTGGAGDLTQALLASVKVNIFGRDGNQISSAANPMPVSVVSSDCTAGNNAPQNAPVVEVSARPKVDYRKDVFYGQEAITYNGTPGYLVGWYVYMDQFDPAGASSKGGQPVTGPVTMPDVATNFPANAVWYDCFKADGQGTITCPAQGTPVVNAPAGNGNIVLTPRPAEADQFLIAGGVNTYLGSDPNTSSPQRLSTSVVRFFVPVADILNAGGQINLRNDIPAASIRDGNNNPVIDPRPNPSSSTSPNNGLQVTVTASLEGGYRKYVADTWNAGVPYWGITPGTTGAGDIGPQGGGFFGDSGAGITFPGDYFYPRIDVSNPNIDPATNVIICESFNAAEVRVAEIPQFPGQGAGDLFAGYNNGPSGRFPNGFTIEYGVSPSTATTGPSTRCDTADATWYPSLTAAAGAGAREQINRVRMLIPVLASGNTAYLVVAQQARPGVNGTVIEDYASVRSSNIRGTSGTAGDWVFSSYNPATNDNVVVGKRLTLTTALARIQKEAALTETGAAINQIGAGSQVAYQLTPSLNSPVTGLAPTFLTIVDTLPAPLQYVADSSQLGGVAITPDSVVVNGTGTVITWTLNNVSPNTVIPTLTFRADVPQTVVPNSVYTNSVVISTPVDSSELSQRTATKPLTVLNPPGLYVFKAVDAPLINPNGSSTWTVQVANFEAAATTVDIIDVLPFIGDGRTPATNFAGTSQLSGAITVPGGGTVRYSSRPSGSVLFDPVAAGNTADIAGGWCLPAEFGSAGCPASFADATAFRVTGASIAGDSVLTLNFTTNTNANTVGNIYTNRFYAKSADPLLTTLRSNDVSVTVALGSISGRVYRDDNSTAVQDGTESGIQGVTVTLCRTNTNPCPAGDTAGTTTTAANGDYSFPNLVSGTYFVFETQPAGYTSGPANAVGSAGGTATGTDSFTGIVLAVGANGTNYNFGELGSTPVIGTRKLVNTAPVAVSGSPGSFDIPFRVVTNNTGTTGLTSVSVTDTVCGPSGTFATATSCAIQVAPVVTVTGSGTTATTAGAAYTGLTAGNNLLASGAVLQPGGEITIDFTVRVALGNTLSFNNSATSTGTPTNGAPAVSDVSNNGPDFTSGGDTSPTGPNSNTPTPIQFAALQGRVFLDAGRDGDPAGDTPIAGVAIVVTGGGLTAPLNVTTDTNGNYVAIVPVSTAPYTITETQPATYDDGRDQVGTGALDPAAPAGAPLAAPTGGAASGVPTAGTGNGVGADSYSGIIASTPGNTNGNFNFGETQGAGVSGRVYLDTTANGVNDGTATDPGVDAVAITLCRTAGVPCAAADVVATTTTAADGTYTFNDVQPGNYFVQETQPSIYGSSTVNVQPITRTANTPVTDVDFGETLGRIAGFVYSDDNASNVREAGTDTGIANITVTLTGTDANNQPVNLTATTLADGSYVINNVPVPLAGTTYTLTEGAVPAIYANGATNVGTPNFAAGSTATAAGTPNTAASTITGIGFTPPNGPVTARTIDGTDYNFGELPRANVSGRVYIDTTANGTNDGNATDPGVTGVTLTLCRAAGVPCAPADVVATTTTAADGTYTFLDVPTGNFFVQETQPSIYGSSTPNVQPVTRTGATSVTDVDFGETLGRIAGFVYEDSNSTNVRDGGDVGIGGIVVTLTGTDANNQPVNLTATTQPDGSYVINNIPVPLTGTTYTLTEGVVPATYANGATNVGTPNFAAGSTNTAAGTANAPASTITGIGFTPPVGPVTAATINGTDYNFGELPRGGVSGRVYRDTDVDGVNDGTTADPGIAGVTITLCRTAGVPCAAADVVGTTTTAADGTYSFPDVPAGSFFVQQTQPSAYGTTTVNVVPITRTSTNNVTDIDFGESLGRIAGFVYEDGNANNARDGGDVGIGGITVTLTGVDANGQSVTLTATTQPDGSYVIDNIPVPQAGTTYTLTEGVVPATYANGDTDVGTPNFASGSTSTAAGSANAPASTITGIGFTPPSGPVTAATINGTDYNFGELPLGDVSGRVYLDTAANGANDGTVTDPGVGGVTLTLCRTAGVPCAPADVVATTTTAPDGTYTFPGVPTGNFFVQETQPSIYGSSTVNVQPVTRTGTNSVTNVDFGETGAVIRGNVYQDNNQNGTLDAGDVGIAGVTVTLTGTNASGQPVTLTTVTLADGSYVFNNVPAPGAAGYTITEAQNTVPAGLINGTTNVGTITPNGGAAAATGTANNAASTIAGVTWTPPTNVAAAPNTVGANYNFGEIQAANLSGSVIRDRDRDGTPDAGEPGIAGVTITLCRTAGVPCAAADVIATTTTGSDGSYSFPNTPAGSYFIQETQPNTLGNSPGSANVIPVTIVNTDIVNQNFLDMPAELSGAVYRDNNNNGVRDGGEPGIAGVTVTLTGTDAAGNPVSLTTTTDSSGNYIFRDLPAAGPGGYTIVEASQPPQTADSASNPGGLVNDTGAAVTTGTGTSGNRNTINAVVLPAGGVGSNYLFGDVPNTAGVSGTVWRDNDHDRILDPGEAVVQGWTVQLIRTDAAGNNPVVVATTTTNALGQYSFTNLPPGPNYQVVFRSPDARGADGQPIIFGTPVNGEQGTGTAPIAPTIANGIIQNLTLVADTVVPQQSLPLDPGGVVYDAVTRQPVAGAVVTITGPAGFNPAIHLVGGAPNASQTTGATGVYQFLLLPGAPAGNYSLNVTPPSGYGFQSTIIPVTPGSLTPPGPAGAVFTVAPQPGAPQIGAADPTTYYLGFNLTPGSSANVVNNHIPLDPLVPPQLFISKVGDRSTAELGDSIRYTVRVRRVDGGSAVLPAITIFDNLPAGFRYIAGTATVNGTSVADPTGAPGPGLTFVVPGANLASGAEVTLTYRVRLGVGAAQGSGINRAQAGVGVNPNCAANAQFCSNEAQFKVRVTEGVFTSDACVVGKVFVDCNNNHVQDSEEIGIPGVRMYFGDGTYMVSDVEGKYSYCGLKPMTHVLKADPITLPKGSRLTTTSNRNAGDAGSLFVDLKAGELHRADFAEGSCSNTVLEQVKARRSQGEVRSIENEKKGRGPLKFDGKSSDYPKEGTDGANQAPVKPREQSLVTGSGDTNADQENDVPIQELPAASPNTQPPTAGKTQGDE
jgi:large repetitive protein